MQWIHVSTPRSMLTKVPVGTAEYLLTVKHDCPTCYATAGTPCRNVRVHRARKMQDVNYKWKFGGRRRYHNVGQLVKQSGTFFLI